MKILVLSAKLESTEYHFHEISDSVFLHTAFDHCYPFYCNCSTSSDKLTCLFIHPGQEILYQLIQGSNGSGSSRTHSTPSFSYSHDRTSNERKSSGVVEYELQLAIDEALAKELQEMEGKLANTSLNDNNG